MVVDVVSALAPSAEGQAETGTGMEETSGSIMLEISDEDLFLSLAKSIAAVDPTKKDLGKKCTELLSQDQLVEALKEIVGASENFIHQAPPNEAESGFTILAHLIARLPEDIRNDLASKLCGILTARSDGAVDVALSVLMRSYNAFPSNSKGRFTTLMAVLNFAVQTGRQSKLAPILKGKGETLAKEFSLKGENLRSFYATLAGIFSASSKEQYMMLTNYLASFIPSEIELVKTHAEALKIATKAVVIFVTTQDNNLDAFQTKVFEELGKVAAFKMYSTLIQILVECDVKKMKTLVASNEQALTNAGLSGEACINKVRLMALAGMANDARKSHGEISYTKLVDALDIPPENLETELIKAIGLKVIDGRMDQLNQKFQVQRSTHAVFGDSEWSDLKDKVGKLQNNMTRAYEKLGSGNNRK